MRDEDTVAARHTGEPWTICAHAICGGERPVYGAQTLGGRRATACACDATNLLIERTLRPGRLRRPAGMLDALHAQREVAL